MVFKLRGSLASVRFPVVKSSIGLPYFQGDRQQKNNMQILGVRTVSLWAECDVFFKMLQT